jgi:hypothetical protein
VSFDAKLVPYRDAGVLICDADAKPVLDASMFLFDQNASHVWVQNGAISSMGKSLPLTSDPEGRVHLPAEKQKFAAVITAKFGYATVTSEQLASAERIMLTPWCVATGRSLESGGAPARKQTVLMRSEVSIQEEPFGAKVGFESSDTTNDNGEFRIERCVPGPATAGRYAVDKKRNSSAQEFTNSVKLSAGETNVTIGRTNGRRVTGTIVPPENPPNDWQEGCMVFLSLEQRAMQYPPNWKDLDAAAQEEWLDKHHKSDAEKMQDYATATRFCTADEQGRFSADDVEPGRYRVQVTISATRRGEPRPTTVGVNMQPQMEARIGTAIKVIDVPEGPATEVLDIGEITVKAGR